MDLAESTNGDVRENYLLGVERRLREIFPNHAENLIANQVLSYKINHGFVCRTYCSLADVVRHSPKDSPLKDQIENIRVGMRAVGDQVLNYQLDKVRALATHLGISENGFWDIRDKVYEIEDRF